MATFGRKEALIGNRKNPPREATRMNDAQPDRLGQPFVGVIRAIAASALTIRALSWEVPRPAFTFWRVYFCYGQCATWFPARSKDSKNALPSTSALKVARALLFFTVNSKIELPFAFSERSARFFPFGICQFQARGTIFQNANRQSRS
jgi:hypothetical protein